MIIIGADFHPAYQVIASVNTDTGECEEKRLAHPQEAEEFYRANPAISAKNLAALYRTMWAKRGKMQWHNS